MKHPPAQRRRALLATVGAAGALLGLGATTACSSEAGRDLAFSSLDDAMEELTRLSQAKELTSSAAWSWPHTLVHCAQSIEYSMAGFPQPKPALFQHTVGAAAFGFFSWRGQMHHDLAEPIPGAPAFDPAVKAGFAVELLQVMVLSFNGWTQELKPHFAYGALDKAAYARAHAMHLANHFSAFAVKT